MGRIAIIAEAAGTDYPQKARLLIHSEDLEDFFASRRFTRASLGPLFSILVVLEQNWNKSPGGSARYPGLLNFPGQSLGYLSW